MIRQRVLVTRERNAVIGTGPAADIDVHATVDDEGQLTVVFTYADEPDGKMPTELFRFNRFETSKIRAVLAHTGGL